MSEETVKKDKEVSNPGSGSYFRLMGYYNINDIKYDLLKIIQPYDGYMYNEKDTNKLINIKIFFSISNWILPY